MTFLFESWLNLLTVSFYFAYLLPSCWCCCDAIDFLPIEEREACRDYWYTFAWFFFDWTVGTVVCLALRGEGLLVGCFDFFDWVLDWLVRAELMPSSC